jgi:hypothetical protein
MILEKKYRIALLVIGYLMLVLSHLFISRALSTVVHVSVHHMHIEPPVLSKIVFLVFSPDDEWFRYSVIPNKIAAEICSYLLKLNNVIMILFEALLLYFLYKLKLSGDTAMNTVITLLFAFNSIVFMLCVFIVSVYIAPFSLC